MQALVLPMQLLVLVLLVLPTQLLVLVVSRITHIPT